MTTPQTEAGARKLVREIKSLRTTDRASARDRHRCCRCCRCCRGRR